MSQYFKNCINCKERYPGCHDECKLYLQDRRKLDRDNKKRRKDLDLNAHVIATQKNRGQL